MDVWTLSVCTMWVSLLPALLSLFGTDADGFATWSNLAYLASILVVHAVAYDTSLVIALVLAGSASFAHHSNRSARPQHTLDIFGGWLLYVTLTAHLARTVYPSYRVVVDVALAVGILLLCVYYDAVYGNQMTLYLTLGGVSYWVAFVRILYVRRRLCMIRWPVLSSVLDVASLLVLQAASAVLQGEVWVDSKSHARYNVEHGFWHGGNALCATVLALLVSRREMCIIGRKGRFVQCVVVLYFLSLMCLSLTDAYPRGFVFLLHFLVGLCLVVVVFTGHFVDCRCLPLRV